MKQVRRLSREILRQAYNLGRRVAMQDHRLVPYVASAHQYSNYEQFLIAHRYRLEQHPAFIDYENFITALAENEARRCGLKLETAREWEFHHAHVEGPVRRAFWYGWEQVQRMQARYDKEMEKRRQEMEAPKVLKVANGELSAPPPSPINVPEKMDDEDRWDSLATELFERLGGDESEALWEMPTADSQGAKTCSV